MTPDLSYGDIFGILRQAIMNVEEDYKESLKPWLAEGEKFRQEAKINREQNDGPELNDSSTLPERAGTEG
jgi:hypothetical protein